jgi:hypothetical protein
MEPLTYGPAEIVAIALAIRIILAVALVRFGGARRSAPRPAAGPGPGGPRG